VPDGIHTGLEIAEQLTNRACSIPEDKRWFFELIRINLSEQVHERYQSAREIKQDLERGQVTKALQ
jgi:hypothetical protein